VVVRLYFLVAGWICSGGPISYAQLEHNDAVQKVGEMVKWSVVIN